MAEAINRRERKKMHSKQAIVDAAVKMFVIRGYQEATVADIMNEADLGIGTFYNYFESKEEILKYLLAQIILETNQVYEDLLKRRTTFAKLLSDMVLFTAQVLDNKRFVLPLFLSAAQKGVLPKEHMPNDKGMTFKRIFAQIVESGQAAGEFRTDIPAAVITELFHSVFQAASFSSIDISFMENIKYKLKLLLDGIAEIHNDDNME